MSAPSAKDLISLPVGGGAVRAVGESFTADPHTGTGRMSVPIDLPKGRNGLGPTLTLAYSTGHGNGPFGLGWQLNVPGVFRKTAKRVPRYAAGDVFVLSGSEDLVPVSGATDPGTQRYRPRVESAFARIERITAGTDHWQVRTVDGLVSRYGTPRPADAGPDWRDPAVVADPDDPTRILGWLLTSTEDSFGNVIAYEYTGDPVLPQRYLSRIGYADYLDSAGTPHYLFQVRFRYESRPDRTVDRRGGFPVATAWRCAAIEVWTDPGTPQLVRSMELTYGSGANGVSLLTGVRVVGHDGDTTEALPPLEFGYTGWDPARRRYLPLRAPGDQLPDVSLGHPDVDLVDLFGDGLPDVVQLSETTARYWRNRADGRLDAPRTLARVPAGASLGRPGVQIADLDGDGRPDLLVSDETQAGYFPVGSDGGFAPGGYVRYDSLPAFGLRDPDARLIDLDGDGVVDLLRTGETVEVLLNRRGSGWVPQPGRADGLAGLSFRDSRIRLADMTGDGLTDLVMVTNGQVRYWPNLGYGRFGAPVVMSGAPRFDDAEYGPAGFDERRLLLGDVDGDGCADLVYLGPHGATVWVNRCGQSFAPGVTVPGTPAVDDRTSVRLVDMLGTGTAGVLWTYDTRTRGDATYKFLDLTGGTKPYLLSSVDNHAGARTVIEYATSTGYAAADAAAGRPWRTTLPFPVHVVSRTTTTDALSASSQTLVYRYHHGYWDGAEREFRGFGRVDTWDAQTFDPEGGLPADRYSPPTLTRTWFHQGPVGPEFGDWSELDLSDEYWSADPNLLGGGDRGAIPATLSRRGQRDVLRALAGSVLRSELYADDGDPHADRPYTVTEYCYDLVPVTEPDTGTGEAWLARPVVAAHRTGARTSHWERGAEPMTTVTFTDGFDRYGRPRSALEMALPRGWDPRRPVATAEPLLVTLTVTDHATRDDATGLRCDRVVAITRREVLTDGSQSPAELRRAVLVDGNQPSRLLGLTRTRYDGDPFVGLPFGQIGAHALPTATTTLVMTRGTLGAASVAPPYLDDLLPAGLRGEYFRDDALADLAFTRPDPAVDVSWSGGPDPALAQPTFSVRWTGTLTPRFTETYTLTPECLGGIRLWLGDELLIDAWSGDAGPAKVDLVADTACALRVEYRATGWSAGVRLRWSSASQPDEVIPATAFGAPPGEPGTGGTAGDYPAQFQAVTGYVYHDGGDAEFEPGYYTVTGIRYDIHDDPAGRGLPTVDRDPLGHDTTIGYDSFRLLPVSVTDPAGLVRTARYDSRLLKPVEIVDVNGNHTAIGYTPLGLVAWTAALGHPDVNEGDTFEQPGTVYQYGLTAWDDAPGQPIWAHTIRRVDHRWTLVDAENARRAEAGQPPLTDAEIAALFPPDEVTAYPERFLQSRVYRDGLGRDLQVRAQAGTTLVDDLGLSADAGTAVGPLTTHEDLDAVVVSGWRAYDNKGRVVRAWEPVFARGWAYAATDLTGLVSSRTWYDARGAVVLVEHPDGAHDRQVHGIPVDLSDPATYTPTPWETYTYDRNDNAGRTHPTRSQDWSTHWNTPTSTVVDARGRVVVSVSRLGGTEVTTRSRYDIDGRPLQVTDPLGRTASTTVYDLAGRVWSATLLDAGTTTTVLDAAGQVLEHRDAKGALTLLEYDAVGRATRMWARDSGTGLVTLRQVNRYGDAPDSGLTRADAAAANLLGRPFRRYDEAGVVTCRRYDLAGQVIEQDRQVLSTTTLLSAIPGGSGGDWASAGYVTDWQPPSGQSIDQYATGLLDPVEHRTTIGYDALGRQTSVVSPVDATGVRRVVRTGYARSGALARVEVDGTAYITRVLYNARGQQMVVDYGNAVRTRYVHDPATGRLLRQHSQGSGTVVHQDVGYRYDLVGNVLSVLDRAPGSGVPGATPDALDRLFDYDPLYRLTRATGREHQDPLPEVWSAAPRGTDVAATQAYTETYDYDAAGNLLRLGHQAGSAGWTRTATLAPGSNRLGTLSVGDTAFDYGYDACGNMTRETTSRHFGWDAANRLATFRVQPEGATSPSRFTQYRYDASGARVVKLSRTQNGALELTLYLDGGLEVLVLTDATGVTSRHDELAVTDGSIRVVALRIGDPLPGDQRPPVGYQLSDHLGSSVVTLDETGAPVNREEYSPYGETTFGGYARKRYRYTGRERDEESGLAHHGARYYAPWLGRWISCDPAGHVDGATLYAYVRGNPMRLVDATGLAAASAGHTVGLLGDPHLTHVTQLWEKAINKVMKTTNAEEGLAKFRGMVQEAFLEHGMGSNRAVGTARNVARTQFNKVRAAFARLAKAEGISLEGLEVHHLFGKDGLGGLAHNPWEALNPTGLKLVEGKAAAPGSMHNLLHRLESRLKGKAAEMVGKLADDVGETASKAAPAARGFVRVGTALGVVAGIGTAASAVSLASDVRHGRVVDAIDHGTQTIAGGFDLATMASHALGGAAAGTTLTTSVAAAPLLAVGSAAATGAAVGWTIGRFIDNHLLSPEVQNAIGGTINEIVNEGGWKHPFGIGW